MKVFVLALALLVPISLAQAQHLVYDDTHNDPGEMSERLPHEILWGGFAAGAGLAGYAVIMTSNPSSECTYDDSCGSGDPLMTLTSFAALGGIVMTPLGVYLAGEANGGDGNFWSTWAYGGLGVLTGALVVSPLAAIAEPGTEEGNIYLGVALTSMWIGYWVGSVLGYELSSSSEYDNYPPLSEEQVFQTSHVQIMPTAGPTRDRQGVSLGLAGLF